MKILIRAVYAAFALAMLTLGSAALVLPYGVFPETAAALGDEAVHIAQEAGAALVALALFCAWYALHYECSWVGHAILTVFFVLIAAIHWADYFREMRSLSSPLLTSLPAVIFVALGVMRRRAVLPSREGSPPPRRGRG